VRRSNRVTVAAGRARAFLTVTAAASAPGAPSRRARRLVGAALAIVGTLAVVGAVAGAPVASAGEPWSSPAQISSYLLGVSCTSSSFCMAVDADGSTVTYNGTSWSSPNPIDPDTALESVSCTSPSFCAAVDVTGDAFTYDGTSWSAAASIDPGNTLSSVSCTSPSFCVTVGQDGDVVRYDGTSWSFPTSINLATAFLESVSCTSTSFCMAVDDQGGAYRYDGSSWSPASTIDGSTQLSSVSCTSPSFCAAVDDTGNALLYNGTSWSSPALVDGSYPQLDAVSCTSPGFCVAGDAYGNVVIDNGSNWSAPGYVVDNAVTAVSCVSSTSCTAVDDGGEAVTYDGPDAATVTDVEFSGNATSPVVTVSGSGFGTEADLGTPGAAGCSATGSDFGSSLWIQDWTDNWVAGRGAACIGLLVSSYSDNQVVFSFGSDFSSYSLTSGAGFTLSLRGATFSGTVNYSANTLTTSCHTETTGCSTTLAAPSQTVTVTGAKAAGSSATITVSVATEVLPCRNFSYAGEVTTVEDHGLVAGSSVQVTDTITGLPSKKGVLVCYQPVEASPPAPVFLGKCHGKHAAPPCVASVAEAGGRLTVHLLVPAGDPRYHVGGAAPMVTGTSPARAVPGKKLTIKGANLSEVTGVTIGGVPARITKTAPTKVSVIVPAGAKGGRLVVTSLAGSAAAPGTVVVA